MLVSFLFLLIAGLLGGYLAGLIGIGGGIVYVAAIPIALHLLNVPVGEITQYTIANSIFAIFFASTSASYTLVKMNNFYIKPVFYTAIASGIVSLVTLEFLVNTTWYDVVKFNIVIILLLIYMLVNTLLGAKKNYDNSISELRVWHFLFVGLCSGFVTAVSGLGGGIIIIPILNSIFKINIKRAGSISLGVIMITAMLMTFFNMLEEVRTPYYYYSLGYIIFPIGLTLAIGVLISTPFGVRKASLLSQKTISYIYTAVLAIVISKKIIELM